MKLVNGALFGVLLMSNACGVAATASDSEESADWGTVDQAVFNGNTDWTGKNQIRYRTVSVFNYNAGGSFVGSGTLLKPDLLLTARYLVTTDGTASGPLNSASNIRVRTGNLAPAPGGVDICTGASRQADCAVGSSVLATSPTSNLAIVRLANPVSHASLKVPFTPVLAEFTNQNLDGDNVVVTGWGQTSCAGGAMSLAWGTMQADVNGSWINLLETMDSEDASPGDNGGPTWGLLAGYPQVGVHSTVSSSCGASTSVDASLINSLSLVEGVLEDDKENVNTPLSSLTEVDFEAVPGSSPAWAISGGKLKQTANTAPNFALVKHTVSGRAALEFHRVDFDAMVTLSGPDDDWAGLVFHYSDPDNYVLCRANDQLNRVEIVTRRFGQDVVQQSAPWDGVFSNLLVHARTEQNQGRSTSCRFSGGGVLGTIILGYPNGEGPYGGRIGVYNDHNDELTYSNFTSVH